MALKPNEIVINLGIHGGPVYAGRPKGEKVRNKYNLTDADNHDTTVKIIIPDETYTVNSSFFLGLLGESVRHAGSKEAFLEKFTFTTPDIFLSKINDYIARALHEKKPLV